jgi:hypothetical protein
MKKSRMGLGLTLAMALVACGGGGSDAPPAGEKQRYTSLSVGDRWIYRTWSDAGDAKASLERVAAQGHDRLEGRDVVLVSTASLDKGLVLEDRWMQLSDSALTQWRRATYPLPGALIWPRVDVLQFPLLGGSEFTQIDQVIDLGKDLDGDGRNESVKITSHVRVIGFESVQTDAGLFDAAAHVRTEVTQTSLSSSGLPAVVETRVEDAWYAMGIGLVKSDVVVGTPAGLSTSHRLLVAARTAGVPTDTRGPQVEMLTPAIPPSGSIRIGFDEPLDSLTVFNSNVIDLRDPQGVRIPVSLSYERSVMDLYPGTLADGTYTVSVNSTITDLIGNPVQPARLSFTVDGTPPSVVATSPPAYETGVPLDTVFTLDFSELLDAASLDGRVSLAGYSRQEGLREDVPVKVSLNGKRVTVTPLAPLAARWEYTLRVMAGVTDPGGDPLRLDYFLQVEAAGH